MSLYINLVSDIQEVESEYLAERWMISEARDNLTLYVQNATVVVIITVYLYWDPRETTYTWRYCQKIDISTHLESLTINRMLCTPLLRIRWRIRKADATLDFFLLGKRCFS
jgi:hypothetical protein